MDCGSLGDLKKSEIEPADKVLKHSRLSRKLFGNSGAFLGGCGVCLNRAGNLGDIAVNFVDHLVLLVAGIGNGFNDALNLDNAVVEQAYSFRFCRWLRERDRRFEQ